VLCDLLPALEALPAEQRRRVRELLTPHTGVAPARLPHSIRACFSASSLQPVERSPAGADAVCVHSELLRVAAEAVLTADGSIVPDTSVHSLLCSMRTLEQLFVLLEFAALIARQQPRHARDARVTELLRAAAACVGAPGGAFWRDASPASWFNAPLNRDERCARAARAEVESARRGARAPLHDEEAIELYLRMWRLGVTHAAALNGGEAERWALLRAVPQQLATFADEARLRACMTRLRLEREEQHPVGPSSERRGGAAGAALCAACCAAPAPRARAAPTQRVLRAERAAPLLPLAPRGAARAPYAALCAARWCGGPRRATTAALLLFATACVKGV
jgi:hypothetical protein